MVRSGSRAADYREQPPADPVSADVPDEGAADGGNECRETVVTAEQHGLRLDKLLVTLAREFSRSHLQGLIERGHVTLDGVAADASSRRLRWGQRVVLELVPTEESQAFRPEAMPLSVLFEDEHLMVLDKPAGLVVHPAAGNWSGTLLNGLLAHHAGAALLPRAGIVHRLDKDTSGVMMVGKTLPAVTALVRAIAAREVHRRYLAIAQGVPGKSSFSVEVPIGRDPAVRIRMAVVAGGKPARTDVRLVASDLGFSCLSCTLHTGRTHQIRVHLASVGLPLVADAVYGGKPALGLHRQALHATELRLTHPVLGTALAFECPPPADFAAAWKSVVHD
jgi:23S rRNA pseudouridine1911/1915/1917 synthase